MKKILLMGAIVLSVFAFGQNDSIKFRWFAGLKPNYTASYELDKQCTQRTLSLIESISFAEKFVILNDYILCNSSGTPKTFFNVTNGKDFFYIPTDEVEILNKDADTNEAMVYLSKVQDKKGYTDFIQTLNSIAAEQKANEELDARIDMIKKIFDIKGKDGLLIQDFSFSGDYGFIGFSIKIFNTSKKRVKYAKFNISGFNSVDDPIMTISGKNSITFTGVGAVEKGNAASWEFENIWRDNIFSYGRINSVKFEYFDGTIKTFTNVGKYVLSDEELEFLEQY